MRIAFFIAVDVDVDVDVDVLESAIFIAVLRPECGRPQIMDARYLALNQPFSLLDSAFFIAAKRPEIWTPDIWPRIGHFHCRHEARNTDVRYLSWKGSFSLPSQGQKYGRKISCLELAFFIAIERPEILTQNISSNGPFSLLSQGQKYGREISCFESAIFIAVTRPEIWTPDIIPQIGLFRCVHA
jgi:hypothetical protein